MSSNGDEDLSDSNQIEDSDGSADSSSDEIENSKLEGEADPDGNHARTDENTKKRLSVQVPSKGPNLDSYQFGSQNESSASDGRQRRATIATGRSSPAPAIFDPSSILYSRRGSRAYQISEASNDMADDEDLLKKSALNKELVEKCQRLEAEARNKDAEIQRLKENVQKITNELEVFKVKNIIKDIRQEQEPAQPIPSDHHRAESSSPMTNSNFYHKLRLLTQVGEQSYPRLGTKSQPTEIRWIIQMAQNKNEENRKLRKQIEQVNHDKNQLERTYQQEIDSLNSQLRILGEKCLRERVLAEKWFQKYETSRQKLERLEWMHREEKEYRNKREVSRAQSSRLLNGIRALHDTGSASPTVSKQRNQQRDQAAHVSFNSISTRAASPIPSLKRDNSGRKVNIVNGGSGGGDHYSKIRETLSRLQVL